MSSAEPVLRDIGDASEISEARAAVREVATGLDPEVAPSAELVASELVTNALLHGGGHGQLRLERTDTGGLRITVVDQERRLPIVGVSSESSMTGRGLAMVGRLSSAWGVTPLPDGVGKEVWAEVEPGPSVELDVDDLLEAWDDDDAAWAVPGEDDKRYTVSLGEVPTSLLIRAKSHVDNLVREFTLASSGATAGTTEVVPKNLAELIHTVVHNFVDAREAIKRQAVEAYNSGRDHAHLELRLTARAADAGEAYLAALDEVDLYCRAQRLLTLESPPEHRLFRQWYVGELVRQVRAAAAGTPAPPATTFEQRLIDEIASVAGAHRRAARAARLYEVSVALTEVATPEEVAAVVLVRGCAGLGASGVAVLLPGEGEHLAVAGAVGYDEGVLEQLRHEARDADLPGAYALRTGEPVWLESREDLTARFPGLQDFEPGTVSMCAVPFAVGGRRVGVLRLSFIEPRLFDDDERRFLEALGAQCALAFERTHLEQSRDELRRGAFSGADAVASLEELFEALPALVAYLEGPEHVFRFVNRSYQQALPGRQLIGRTIAEALPEANDFGFAIVADRVWATGQAVTGREVLLRLPRLDGTYAQRYADFTFQPIRRGDGAIEGVLVHAVDVTDDVESRRALEVAATEIRQLELQAQEDRFRQAVDGMLDPVMMCRPVLDEAGAVVDLRVEYANAAADPRAQGLPSPVGRVLSELWDGIREVGLLEQYVTVAASGVPMVLDGYHYPTGGVFDIRATRVGDTVFIVYRDVTGRAEREAEVQHHREALAEAQRIARMGSWVRDEVGGEVQWSEEFIEICGFEPGTPPSRERFLALLDEQGRAELTAAIAGSAETGTRFQLERRIVRPDGEPRVLIITGEAATNDRGSITTRGTIQDVTEQRRVEQALRQSEERRQEEHDAVQILQAAILPNELPAIPGASVVARYMAASENIAVGGDFYDVFVLDDERVLLTVGDVAGKGVQAAEAVGQLRNGLRMAAVLDPDPMAIVTSINELVARGFKAPFATAVIAVYRPADGHLEWASAGHLPLVVRRATGECDLVGVDPTHPPVGVSGDRLASSSSLTLGPGDGVLLFTDGLIERRGEDLGDSLDALVRAVAEGPVDPRGLVESVLGRSVGSGPRQDDVCVLALTRDDGR